MCHDVTSKRLYVITEQNAAQTFPTQEIWRQKKVNTHDLSWFVKLGNFCNAEY